METMMRTVKVFSIAGLIALIVFTSGCSESGLTIGDFSCQGAVYDCKNVYGYINENGIQCMKGCYYIDYTESNESLVGDKKFAYCLHLCS